MKKLNLMLFLSLWSVSILFAQEETTENKKEQELEVEYERVRPSDDINTLMNEPGHLGFFGALQFKASEFKNETMVMAGFRGGVIINRKVAIGFEGHGIVPTMDFDNLYPNQRAIPLGGYGGLFVEPIVFSNRVIHFTVPISTGAGWLGYVEDWENNNYEGSDLIEDDVFWYIEPGVNAELNVSKMVRLSLGISKRFVQDLDMTTTTSSDLGSLNYNFTVKVGRF